MSRHTQAPTTRAHERHDPLLVAQVVAGDQLDPARAQEARSWLDTCPECAQLAADLRVASAQVASEPVPPRRRDFRLSPEQAEQLQGNAVTRFLRGLPLPRTGALAPAAAGIMSIGLVFVVAGYAWPEDGSVELESAEDAAPVAVAAPPASLVPMAAPAPLTDATDADARSPAEGAEPSVVGADVDAPAPEVLPDVAREFFADEEFTEDLTEHQSGISVGEGAERAPEAAAADRVAAEAEAPAATSALDMATEPEPTQLAARQKAAAVPGQEPIEPAEVREPVAASDDGLGAVVESSTPPSVVDTAAGVLAEGATGAADVRRSDDAGAQEWLIVIGAVLAIGGAAVLLLGWLVRRSRDPLLR